MADRLRRIIGTEEDKVNCPFYFKIGACRHGDRCSRNHLRPHFSQTVLLPHMFVAPQPEPGQDPNNQAQVEEAFEDFYEEMLEELVKFGEIEELHVVENLGDHMFGNCYVKYHTEEEAEACLKAMNGRYYAQRLITPEYSPVTDFREARCRQFDEATCDRGPYCNFMHMRYVPRHLRKQLKDSQRDHRKKRDRSKSPGRDRSRRDRSRERSRRSRSRGRSRRDRSGEKSRRDRDDKGDDDEAARRAKFAAWNKEKTEVPPAAASDAPAPDAPAPPAVDPAALAAAASAAIANAAAAATTPAAATE